MQELPSRGSTVLKPGPDDLEQIVRRIVLVAVGVQRQLQLDEIEAAERHVRCPEVRQHRIVAGEGPVEGSQQRLLGTGVDDLEVQSEVIDEVLLEGHPAGVAVQDLPSLARLRGGEQTGQFGIGERFRGG